MKRFTFFAVVLLSLTVGTANAAYVLFKVPDAPKDGLDKVVYHITVQDYPRATGYYWADQATFVHGGHAIYIGLQPREKLANYRAVFSVFGKGARGISEHTSDGADGGPGSSGWIAYPWAKGHRYALEIKLIKSGKTHDDEQAWQGSVTDESTHVTTVIASYAVPLAWGHLSPRSVFFAEYFIYNNPKYHGAHPAPRPEEPYAKILVEAPTGSADNTAYDGKISGTKPNKNNPDNDRIQTLSDTTATVESGLSAKAKTDAPATAP